MTGVQTCALPIFTQLKAQSDTRVATNEDFSYVRQNIEQYLKTQADKTATLNERAAIKERERALLLSHTREKERASRKASGVKVYEITVKNADEPGLVEYDPQKEATKSLTGHGRKVPTVSYRINGSATNIAGSNPAGADTAFQQRVSGTNGTTTGTSGVSTNDLKGATATEKKAAAPFDPMLDETQQILLDYISLLSKRGDMPTKP